MSARRGAIGLVAALLALATDRSAARAQAASEAEYAAHATVAAKPGPGASSAQAERARKAAGALGEPARALVTAPGVARSAFDSGELSLWGASSADNRSYIDGIELPMLFHPGGVRTTVHPALLERLTLTPGAPQPDFGRALGGTIELESCGFVGPGFHLDASADPINVSIATSTATQPVQLLVAGRAGYLDRLQGWLAPDSRGVVPLPAYKDAAATLNIALEPDTTVQAAWLGSHDSYDVGRIERDPSTTAIRSQRRAYQLAWLRYGRVFEDGARITLAPFFAAYSRASESRFGDVPAGVQRSDLRAGLRAHYAMNLRLVALRLGFDGQAIASTLERSGTLTLPPREGDLAVFGQPPGEEVISDRWSVQDVNVAPYARIALHLGPVSIEPGLRLEAHALATSRRTPRVGDTPGVGASALYVRPEPRLEASIELAPWVTVAGRAGLQHQPPPAEDRSAVFGNPTLGLSRSYVAALGPRVDLANGLALEVIGFYARMEDLVVRDSRNPPPLAHVLSPDGRGRSYGVQAAVQTVPLDGLSGSLAYTLSRSERTDAHQEFYPADLDQTHVLAALLTYEDHGWTLSARARLSTGAPRWQPVSAYVNLRDNRYEPLFGAAERVRLPVFFAADLHAERAFITSAVTWSVYADVLNLTNHRNVEEFAYSYDYAEGEDIVGLPILALIGLRVTR